MGTFPKKVKGSYTVKKSRFHISDIMPTSTNKKRIKPDISD